MSVQQSRGEHGPVSTGAGDAGPATGPPKPRRGGHLYEVDIVRIVTFAGVIFDHYVSGTTFAFSVSSNAVQMVFHYTRNAFFALTGFVLVYQYRDRELKATTFWRRRFKLIGLPYLFWSVFYWLYGIYAPPWIPPSTAHFGEVFGSMGSTAGALRDLGFSLLTGSAWYHLYFVFVTMQVYLLFPLLLRFLRWSWGYHRYLLAVALACHLVLLHYMVTGVPRMFRSGPGEVLWDTLALDVLWGHLHETFLPYFFYTLAGAITALHLEAFRRVVVRQRWTILAATAAIIAATVVYFLHLTDTVAPSAASNVFEPYTMFMFVAIVLSLYAAGTFWSERRTEGSFWDTLLNKASDRSFGIFLVHAFALQEIAPTIQRFRFQVYAPWVSLLAFVLTVAVTVVTVEMLRRGPISLLSTGREMIPLARQDLRGTAGYAAALFAVGAVLYWALAVDVGWVVMTAAALTFGWNLLGRLRPAKAELAKTEPAKTELVKAEPASAEADTSS